MILGADSCYTLRPHEYVYHHSSKHDRQRRMALYQALLFYQTGLLELSGSVRSDAGHRLEDILFELAKWMAKSA